MKNNIVTHDWSRAHLTLVQSSVSRLESKILFQTKNEKYYFRQGIKNNISDKDLKYFFKIVFVMLE